MAKRFPIYDPARTIHVPGDTHFGAVRGARIDTVMFDTWENPELPNPAAMVQMGDVTQDGTTNQDATAIAYLDAFYLDATPPVKRVVVGNHDTNNVRTADAAAAWGYNGKNWRHTLSDDDGEFCEMIGVSHDGPGTTLELSAATRTWLADAAAEDGPPILLFTHAPLENSVLGNQTYVYSSAEAFFSLDPNADMLALLGSRPRIKAVFGGHTHSPFEAPDCIKAAHPVTGRNVITANASALYYTGRTSESYVDPIRSMFVQVNDDSLDFFLRDHHSRTWMGWPTERKLIRRIPFPA